jgi:hypothetical protein
MGFNSTLTNGIGVNPAAVWNNGGVQVGSNNVLEENLKREMEWQRQKIIALEKMKKDVNTFNTQRHVANVQNEVKAVQPSSGVNEMKLPPPTVIPSYSSSGSIMTPVTANVPCANNIPHSTFANTITSGHVAQQVPIYNESKNNQLTKPNVSLPSNGSSKAYDMTFNCSSDTYTVNKISPENSNHIIVDIGANDDEPRVKIPKIIDLT